MVDHYCVFESSSWLSVKNSPFRPENGKISKISEKMSESTTFILNFQPLWLASVQILRWFLIEQNLKITLSTKISKLVGGYLERVTKNWKSHFLTPQKNVLEIFFKFFHDF